MSRGILPYLAQPETVLPADVWEALRTLLPPECKAPVRGRPAKTHRAVLTGILYALRYDLPWSAVPSSKEIAGGATCLRRLREWEGSGVWGPVEAAIREKLPETHLFFWTRLRPA